MSALVEYLVTNRVVGFLQMDAAVQRTEREGGRLSTSLLEDADIDADVLFETIGDFLGLPVVNDAMLARIDRDLIDSWSATRARRLGALPLRIDGQTIDVAVLDRLSDLEEGIIAEEYGCSVHQHLIPEFRFFELLGRYYGTPVEGRFLRLMTRYPLEIRSLPSLRTTEGDLPVLRPDSENFDSLDDLFEQAADSPDSVGTAGEATPAKPQDKPPGSPAPRKSVTDQQVWDAVKEESGLLEIPNLRRQNREELDAFNSSRATPGVADTMPVPRDPHAPLDSETWSLERLSEFFQSVRDRDQALWAALGFLRRFYSRRLFLRFDRDELVIHCERGFALEDPSKVPSISVRPLSGLDAMRQGRDYFHGPPAQIGLDRLYDRLGVAPPPDMIVLPITIAQNTVMFFVGDREDQPIDPRDLALSFVVRRQISDGLELLLLRDRRQHRHGRMSDDEAAREKRVMKRLTGNFSIPEIETRDRGIVSLPTEGWDLPEAFEDSRERDPRASDARFTPEYDDQDIARQISEDSGWFDIDYVDGGSLRTAEGTAGSKRNATTHGFVPLGMSKEPRSDSYPSILPSAPTPTSRQEEATAAFTAVGIGNADDGDLEESHPDIRAAARQIAQQSESNPTIGEKTPDATSSSDRADDDGDAETPSDERRTASSTRSSTGGAASDANRKSTQEYDVTDAAPIRSAEEEFAREYVADFTRSASDTRELSVATATRLLRESSGAEPLPTRGEQPADDAGRDGDTLMLTPEMRSERPAGAFEHESGSQPRVEFQRTRERPTASAPPPRSDEPSESSELINIRQMRMELEGGQRDYHSADPALDLILRSDDREAIKRAVDNIVQRPASGLPYLANVFPAPLWLDRTDAEQAARPVYEHGPLLRIIYERLPAYVEQLWACLEQSSADARYYALRLLAFVRELNLRESLLGAIFDRDNDVRRLALQLIHNHRAHINIKQVTDLMEAGLESDNRHIVESSIVALTKLRATGSVSHLIDTLEHEDEELSQRARESLLRLTFETPDLDTEQWRRWLETHGGEPQELWLARAMTSDDRARRETAAKYIRRMTRLAVNYHADISERQRRIARRTVEQYFGL